MEETPPLELRLAAAVAQTVEIANQSLKDATPQNIADAFASLESAAQTLAELQAVLRQTQSKLRASHGTPDPRIAPVLHAVRALLAEMGALAVASERMYAARFAECKQSADYGTSDSARNASVSVDALG